MQVRLQMDNAGWMTLDLEHGPHAVQIVGGYLADSPGDLLDALVRLVTGREQEARVLFNQEPGEWLLRMRTLPGRLLRVEVHGPGEDGPPPEPLGEPVFRHTEPAERFASRVWHEFERVLREIGEDGYVRRWGLYPFPRRAYDALEAPSACNRVRARMIGIVNRASGRFSAARLQVANEFAAGKTQCPPSRTATVSWERFDVHHVAPSGAHPVLRANCVGKG